MRTSTTPFIDLNGPTPLNPLEKSLFPPPPRVGSDSSVYQAQHQTLHLYQPEQIAALTPCTLILNILPPQIATSLLTSLLHEAQEWRANRFRLFERVVQTKSTSCLYVDREDPLTEKEYIYNGSKVCFADAWLVGVIKTSSLMALDVSMKRFTPRDRSSRKW